jgi:FAD/FMN-containing dehydrogenase
VIARCLTPGDIAAAFDFARGHELEVAVRGGGHNPAGHCVSDGGLVIDLSLLRGVEVDAERRVARAGGGATWLDFDTATQESGLVCPGGVVGSTGVCGLALGGGIGHLTAQHSLTCDNLVGAELVTSAGTVRHASAEEDPELLWGLRGGGGNFGAATRLDFRLHRLSRVVGGSLVYRGRGVREALRRFGDITARSPRDLSCQAELSVDMSLTPTLELAPCYTGSHAEEDLRWLGAAPGLEEDNLREHGFLDQQRLSEPSYGEDRHYWKGHFVRELGDELIDVLLGSIVALGRPPGRFLIESLHGAPKDVDPSTAAVGFRGAAFNLSVMAVWADPDLDHEEIGWARETAAAIEPWSASGGGYVNYMQEDEPLERVRAAFGAASFIRLQALKSRLDPDNVLHRNQNIPPRRGQAEADAG